MITTLSIIAYLSLGIIIYIYAGYPLVLFILASTLPAAKIKKDAIRPMVTLIISCYNEEDVLPEKLQNSFSLDYPKDLIEIIVVSDGSSDRTDEIALAHKKDGVKLIRQEGRLGKTMGLNLAVPQANGDIIVFSDANAIYQADAVTRLVENFADQTVGYVVGEAQYINSDQTSSASNEDTYWQYEIFIKTMESRIHSMVGGDGAIYAVRKKLYEPLKQTDINDFVNPLQIISKGYRGIYEPLAVCREEAAGSFEKEFRRKARIVNRAFTGLMRVKEVLNPLKSGFFSFEVISHKLLRWFAPFFLLSTSLPSVILAFYSIPIFQLLTCLIAISLTLSLFGVWAADKKKEWPSFLFLPYYFLAVNIASMSGVIQSLKGDVQVTWDTVRSDTEGTKHLSHKTIYYLCYSTLPALAFFLIWFGAKHGTIPALELLFWALLSLIFYVYFGYPLILLIWSQLPTKPLVREEITPTVTILICAYNEDEIIEQKIKNSFELDYPSEKLKIIIASDGSSDQTNEIVSKYENNQLTFLHYAERRGKIGAILNTMPQINSEIVIFSDANTLCAKDAVKKIVRNFTDPTIGAVSADVILQNDNPSFSSPETAYYLYERWIQHKETKIGSIIGADGGMYAIRRKLFVPPSINTILDDFVISMNIAILGYRVIYDEEAKGYERSTISHKSEFSRKSRVIAGCIQSVKQCEGVPGFNQPSLLFCYLSHKFLRWMAPIFLVALFFTNITLAVYSSQHFFKFILAGQLIFYGLAMSGCFLNRSATNKFSSIPFYFCLENGAALYGLYKGLLNKQKVTWTTFARGRGESS